ncbi:MAG: PD-(D/E)XK nuclease family protein, partial [Actinomycetota bacterium]|nr:PD-(D/E)XK nuclease family protein [Actinomycetota bacterium]
IYRFRRADVDLFLAASARFGSGDRGLSLTSNFRTVEPILEFVNGLFASERMADAPAGGAAPAYEALDAARPAPSALHRPLVFGGPSDALAGERRSCEAVDVARVVRDIGRHPERWQVFDKVSEVWRDPRLADVTVLLPARTSLPYLRAELDAAGIVYRLDTGSLVFATQEVADVLATVRAIADSSDAISLVAALRSTLYACSDVDLYTYRQAGGRWEVAAPLPSGLEVDHPVVAALAHMRSLWTERWWIGPAALVERIVTERRAMLAALGTRRPRDVWRRLRFLVDQARAFEDSGQRGLREFVEWAELQRSDSARIHEPILPETDDDAVRVMTIHGAKGLEFPITIVSGLTTGKSNARRLSVLWDGDVPAVYLNSGNRTQGFDRRADIEDEMDGHERLRLLYVALTRARDHLVVSGHHKTGVGSHGELVWAYAELDPDRCRRLDDLDDVAELDRVDEVDDKQPRPRFDAAAAASARDDWLDRRRRLASAGARPSVLSATGVASLGDRLPGVDVVTDEDLGPDDEPASIPIDGDDDNASRADGAEPLRRRRQGRAGTAIGRAVHATLQSLDLATIDPDSPVIDQIAAREAELEAVVEAASQIAGGVRSALASDAVALARRHPHHKEMFVAAPVGTSAVEGYIDLLLETPEGLVIIDYKTDTVRNDADVDAKLAHYSLQGATYAVALEAVTGLPVVDCRFVFCRASGAIERSVDDLLSVMDEVRARLASV